MISGQCVQKKNVCDLFMNRTTDRKSFKVGAASKLRHCFLHFLVLYRGMIWNFRFCCLSTHEAFTLPLKEHGNATYFSQIGK